MFKNSRLLSNMFDRDQQQNYTYTTTSSFQISDEIIWLEAVNNALRRDNSASAISAADKVLAAYKQRFCKEDEENQK